jgi:AcrR family transcriptional regulator
VAPWTGKLSALRGLRVHFCAMKRKYELKARARRQAETRERIVEAAVELHTSVGPARTTISAIAERAGVERHTVYAHFADERKLFDACSTHWAERHPFPDLQLSLGIVDPETRLQAVLHDLYRWYEEVESDVAIFRRDAQVHELNAENVAEDDRRLAELADELARGRPRRKPVRAAIGHVLEFETWRSLVRRQELSLKQAVESMTRLVASV